MLYIRAWIAACSECCDGEIGGNWRCLLPRGINLVSPTGILDHKHCAALEHSSCPFDLNPPSQNFEIATFASTTQKCKACEKTVYLVDQLTTDNKIYHRFCFRCHHCKGTLKFALSQNLLVVAGEESREKVDQKLREMKVLEAVYPHPSAIPPRERRAYGYEP